jgi:hypothetical protein
VLDELLGGLDETTDELDEPLCKLSELIDEILDEVLIEKLSEFSKINFKYDLCLKRLLIKKTYTNLF